MINFFRKLNPLQRKKNFYYKYVEKEIKEGQEGVYPPEFAIIDFNSIAKDNGLFENYNKEITIFRNGSVHVNYPYSQALIKTILLNNKIPFLDLTQKKLKLRIRKIIRPDLIQYYEEA